MAEGKKSFIAYSDWQGTFKALPDDIAGQLIKYIFSYVNDEEPEPHENFVVNALFEQFKAALKRDLDKWEKQREQRSKAGKKSAELRATKSNERSTSVNEKTRKPTVSVSDSVNVSDTNSIYIEKQKLNSDYFISQFNRARYFPDFKLNLPKNQNTGEEIHIKLTSRNESSILFLANKGYTNQDGKDAIVGMMLSDINQSIKKTPNHMLDEDNFIKYLDSYRTGKKIKYGFDKSKDKV